MRKIFLSINLVVFVTTICLAQSTIQGRIIENETEKPIAFASVSITDKKGTVSDENGNFKFENLRAGNYVLRISFVGFDSFTKNISIADKEMLNLQIELISANITAKEVVITATKTENYLYDIPIRVNLMSSRQIESIPTQTTDELLAFVPGVNINRSFGIFSHTTAVTMRGLNGNEQGRVLVMIDGIPVNKSDGGSVNWNLLNNDQIERIEVVKGPSSSLYGGNAMGGAINIITKKSTEKIQGKVSVDYSTYNTMRGQVYIAGRANPNTNKGLYWNISSFYRQSDGYMTASEADQLANEYLVKSDLKELAANAKIGYDFNTNNSIEMDLVYYDDDRGIGEKVYQPQGNNREHDTYQARLKYSGSRNKVNWNINLFYLNEDYKRITEFMKKNSYTFYKVLSERVDLGALSTVSYSLSNQTITGGIDLKQGSVAAKDVYHTSSDIVYNRGKMNSMGLFLQDEISLLNEKLKVITGLRFDYAQFFDGAFEIENPTAETAFMLSYQNDNIRDTWNALSPKISMQYELTNSSRVYASYSKGFRPAVLDDMSRSGRIKGGFKIANPSLRPEYLNNFEIGADARFFQRLRTSLSTFYSMGDDFIYNVTTGDSINLGKLQPIIKASNISKVEIFGVEFEANYFLNDQLSVNANYAFAHSQIKEFKPLNVSDPVDLAGNYLADVPSHTASISAYWRNKIVNTSITARYTGSRWANDVNKFDDIIGNDKYPSYTTIDLKLSKPIKMTFVSLSIQNVLDTKFYDGSGAVCPGRFISLELGVRF